MAIEMKEGATGRNGRGIAPAADAQGELEGVRRRIREVDAELVRLIIDRCRLAGAAGVRKAEAGLPIVDPAQEASVVRRGAEEARSAGIDEELVRQIFWCLIDMSRSVQRDAPLPAPKGRCADPLPFGVRGA